MKRTLGLGIVVLSCLAACGATDGVSESHEADAVSGSAIVRADADGGSPAAVAVVVRTFFGSFSYCSGVYVAPRVVLTAAHCLSDFVDRVTVYYGPNAVADKELLGEGDDPTQPWTGVESWFRHPDYDANLHYPDLAVVYLKRSLPFEPVKLARFPLGSSAVGTQMRIVGWGASRALTPDVSQHEGIGIQRSASVPFLGSPTEADFVPEDPNNGLFVPEIRANLAKFDGIAPESNSCAGDSGAPVFATQGGGEKFVAAINFFTGLSCEGYSMATRVEPFLPFFDQAIEQAGALALDPTLQCVEVTDAGVYTAYFGYENENVVSLDVPHGQNNQLSGGDPDVPSTHFLPGDHPWNFFVDFSQRDKVRYRLRNSESHGGGPHAVTANSRSARCDANAADVACARSCRAFEACEIEGYPFASCMADCLSNLTFFEENAFPQCVEPFAAFQRCLAAVPSADLCNFDDPPPFCVAESQAYDACFVTE